MPFRALSLAFLVAVSPVAVMAETTLSSSNGPAAQTAALATLLGAEKTALAQMPRNALAPRKASKGKPDEIRYDAEWLAAQPEGAGGAEWECLARAVYFEARGETIAGQFAVAEVVLNRTDSPLYPSTVCAVVGQRGGGGCQFSYACDGASDAMRDPEARSTAGKVAAILLGGAPRTLTDGATHFHTRAVQPGWAARFDRTASIGAHYFYRQPGAMTLAAN